VAQSAPPAGSRRLSKTAVVFAAVAGLVTTAGLTVLLTNANPYPP